MKCYAFLVLLIIANSGYAQTLTSGATLDPKSKSSDSSSPSASYSLGVVADRRTVQRQSPFWDYIPRPYVYAGPELMGAGYAALAYLGGAGVRVDAEHLLFDAHADYDNGRKSNDGTGYNKKGHDRGLSGSLYYRLHSGWAFGGGAGWGQLSTTNYTKSAWRPRIGGSKDFFTNECRESGCRNDFTMRLGLDYLLKGGDWQNGSQGVAVSFYLPSPAAKRHLFWRESIGIYRFYDTVTDRNNHYLTQLQMSKHHSDSFAEFTIMYRF